MGVVIRRSGTVAFLSYVGFFVGYVNMLWLLPYVFEPEEVGLIRLIILVATLLSTLGSLGSVQVATRYYPFFSGDPERRAAFMRLIALVAAAGSLLVVLVLVGFRDEIADVYREKSPLFVTHIWYVLPIALSLLLYGVVESFVVVQQYPVVPTMLREIYVRLALASAAVMVLVVSLDLTAYLDMVSVLYCFAPLAIIAYARSRHLLDVSGPVRSLPRPQLREVVQFGGFMFMGNASAIAIASVAGVVLSAYEGLLSTGIYTIALFIATIIEIPKRSLSQVLIPMVVTANKEEDTGTLSMLYKKSSINQFVVGSGIFLLIWTNIDGIFSLIPNGQVYAQGKWAVLFISLARLFDMLTGTNAEIIGTSRYYKVDLFIYLGLSIVGIGIMMVMVSAYGLIGAALAVLASMVLLNVVRFGFIFAVMRIQPFSWRTAVGAVCALAAYGVSLLLPPVGGTIIDIAVRSILVGTVFVGSILIFRVSDDISGLVSKILARFAR